MLSRKTEANLLKMAKDPSFHTVSHGDSVHGVVAGPGHKRKLLFQGGHDSRWLAHEEHRGAFAGRWD